MGMHYALTSRLNLIEAPIRLQSIFSGKFSHAKKLEDGNCQHQLQGAKDIADLMLRPSLAKTLLQVKHAVEENRPCAHETACLGV